MSRRSLAGWTIEDAFYRLVPWSVLEPWLHPYRKGDARQLFLEREGSWDFEGVPARWFWEQKHGDCWQDHPQGSDEWCKQEKEAKAAKEAARLAEADAPWMKEEERRRIIETENAPSAVLGILKQYAECGSISAWGILGAPIGSWVKIPPQHWIGINGFLIEGSIVGVIANSDDVSGKDRGQAALRQEWSYHSVLVYPAVLAPDAIEMVTGLSLADVVARFIWGDPEALKIRGDVLEYTDNLPNGTPDIVSDKGMVLALLRDAEEMRHELDRIGLASKLGLDVVEADGAASHYLDVLADRLAALGELIATDRIGLVGFDDDSGERVSINPVDLKAGRLLLCLGTGDLYRPGDGNPVIRNVRVVEPSAEMEAVTSTENLSDESTADDDGALVGDEGRIGAPPSRHDYKWREALEIVIGRALRHEGKPINNYTQLCDGITAVMIDELGMDGGLYKVSDTVRRKTKVYWPWLRAAAGGED